jgi:hypothetical protein
VNGAGPAKAGIQRLPTMHIRHWIPVFTGMTVPLQPTQQIRPIRQNHIDSHRDILSRILQFV